MLLTVATCQTKDDGAAPTEERQDLIQDTYADLEQVEQAIDDYEQALAISRESGDRRGEGTALGNLGVAYAVLGQVERAIEFYEQALAIFEEIKSPHADSLRRWLAELEE